MTSLLDLRALVKTYGSGEAETRVLRGLPCIWIGVSWRRCWVRRGPVKARY